MWRKNSLEGKRERKVQKWDLRYSTLMGISGGVVTEGVTGGELRVRTIGDEQGEEDLETSCE